MKRILLSVLCVIMSSVAFARGDGYEEKKFISEKGDTLRFQLLEPENVQPGYSYPLVLFLHGAGERGNDNQKQLMHGGQMFLNPVNRDEHPSYVIFPQCPEGKSWAYDNTPSWGTDPWALPSEFPESSMAGLVVSMLKQFFASHPQVDLSRVYVVGLSMGGIGSYEMAVRHPDIFAAAVPICGCVNPSRLSAARGVSFSLYHGDADNVVPTAGSREAYKALKKAGIPVRYREFPGCSHASWNPAFNEPDFMSWLYSQHK